MKNFSELLATDQFVQVRLIIDGHYTCQINGKNTQDHCVELRKDITIEVRSESGKSAEIKSVSLDDFEIVPNWTHLAEYSDDTDRHGPTTYLDNNGIWKLSISKPFYQWRHETTGQGWLFYQNAKK